LTILPYRLIMTISEMSSGEMQTMLHSTAFKRHIPGPTVMNRRRAWKVGETQYEVVSRAADQRYRVEVEGGMPLCSCEAARFGRPCYHAAVVLRRLMNEGR
jgi:SWIM zinc finger